MMRAYAANPGAASNIYISGNDGAQHTASMLLDGEEGEAYLRTLCDRRALAKIATLWVNGADVEWTRLHDQRPARIALPLRQLLRRRCWFDGAASVPAAMATAASSTLLMDWVTATVAELLGLAVTEVSPNRELAALGAHSLTLVKLRDRIEQAFKHAIPMQELATLTTVDAITQHLASRGVTPSQPGEFDHLSGEALDALFRRLGGTGSVN